MTTPSHSLKAPTAPWIPSSVCTARMPADFHQGQEHGGLALVEIRPHVPRGHPAGPSVLHAFPISKKKPSGITVALPHGLQSLEILDHRAPAVPLSLSDDRLCQGMLNSPFQQRRQPQDLSFQPWRFHDVREKGCPCEGPVLSRRWCPVDGPSPTPRRPESESILRPLSVPT